MINNHASRVIKVGLIYNPPYSYGIDYANSSRPGFSIELLRVFCQLFSFRCIIQEANSTMYGRLLNGTWYGMIGQIIDNTFDISHPNFDPTEQRFQFVDFSLPLTYSPVLLVTRKPTFYGNNVNLLNSLVFHWTVWLCILLFAIYIGLFIKYSWQINLIYSEASCKIDVITL